MFSCRPNRNFQRDEVAKAIGRNISAKEAMLRFDEHFIRGPLGRHAGSNKYWSVLISYYYDSTSIFFFRQL